MGKIVDFFKQLRDTAKKEFRVLKEWGETPGQLENKFNNFNDYLSAAQTITWVSVSCSLIGEDAGAAKGSVYDLKGKEVKDDDLTRLMKRPNPLMTGFQFKEIIAWHLLLTGNAYVWKTPLNMLDKREGRPGLLWVINPALMEPKLNNEGTLAGYRLFWNGEWAEFAPETIMHIKLPNPRNDFVGMGKIQANATLYNTERAAQFYNWNFFDRGGAPSTALTFPHEIQDDQRKEIEERFKKYQGYKKSHGMIILTGGMDIKNIGLSQKDMMFIEQRKFTREEILAMFKVPPAKAGIFEYANYSNAKEQDSFYWDNAIQPLLRRLQAAFTIGIIQLFNEDWEYIFDDVSRKDLELNMKLAKDGISSGLLSPNEGRVFYLDMPKVDKNPPMDAYYLPINMFPIGETPAPVEPEKMMIEGDAKGNGPRITRRLQQQILRTAISTRARLSKNVKKEMVKFFDGQMERVLEKVKGKEMGVIETKIVAGDIFDKGEEAKLLKASLKKGFTSVVMRSIEDLNEELGTDIDSSTQNPQVTARIGKLENRSTRINDTTFELIEGQIKAGVDAGESIGEIKKRIEQNVYKQKIGYRAEMIARTESSAAYDKGSVLNYEEVGVKYVDVIGCECSVYPCNARHIPINEADNLDFHPNHKGVIVPEVTR